MHSGARGWAPVDVSQLDALRCQTRAASLTPLVSVSPTVSLTCEGSSSTGVDADVSLKTRRTMQRSSASAIDPIARSAFAQVSACSPASVPEQGTCGRRTGRKQVLKSACSAGPATGPSLHFFRVAQCEGRETHLRTRMKTRMCVMHCRPGVEAGHTPSAELSCRGFSSSVTGSSARSWLGLWRWRRRSNALCLLAGVVSSGAFVVLTLIAVKTTKAPSSCCVFIHYCVLKFCSCPRLIARALGAPMLCGFTQHAPAVVLVSFSGVLAKGRAGLSSC